jgi:CHRD domain
MTKIFAAFAVVAALAASPAYADMMKYKASLSGPGEVPPNTTTGTGNIEATYDSATKTLSWSGEYSGLTGPELAAHFHGPAAAGTNAGVLVPVDAKASPFKGSATLTDEQAKDFADGKVYFNIHTAANKGGEIRGQMAPGM